MDSSQGALQTNENLFQISNLLLKFWQKPKNIHYVFKRIAGYYIFDFIHRWIRLNELYKLIKNLFASFKFVLNNWPKTKKYSNE